MKVHGQHLRLANLQDWEIPKDAQGHGLRASTYVVPPLSDSSSEESDNDAANGGQLAGRFCRRERSDSSSEDDIPLQELRDRIRARKQRVSADSTNMSHSESTDNISDNDHTSVLSS